jgi:hypothetical protein
MQKCTSLRRLRARDRNWWPSKPAISSISSRMNPGGRGAGYAAGRVAVRVRAHGRASHHGRVVIVIAVLVIVERSSRRKD